MAGFLKKYKQNKLLLTGGILVFSIIVLAVAAPLLSPCDPNGVKVEDRLQTPGEHNLMGTDGFGRDILSRVIYGARFSLTLAVVVVAVNFVLGLLIGSVAGYFGGFIDEFIMRIVDVLMAFPNIILALCIVGVLGPTIQNLIIALVILGWVGYARIARGLVLSVKEQVFISAARALGAGSGYIILRHVIPNVIPPLIVLATLHVGHTILSVAALSFLGLGVQPPTPEWGAMLNEGKQFVFTHPHVMVFPGLAITVTVFAFNVLGEGLRDILDPRSRETVKT
ncbi:MAG: ABC transporter permease [Peptococcaceae bacterium]|nr:ABC transporter permease [Peptococcaceae bacterium]